MGLYSMGVSKKDNEENYFSYVTRKYEMTKEGKERTSNTNTNIYYEPSHASNSLAYTQLAPPAASINKAMGAASNNNRSLAMASFDDAFANTPCPFTKI